MQFKYNSFNVECSASETAGGYLGQPTISRPASRELEGSGVRSGYLRSFDSEAQALGFARSWAERWCDTHQAQSSPRFVGDVIKDVAHLIYRLEARDPVLENLARNPDPGFVGLATRVEFVGARNVGDSVLKHVAHLSSTVQLTWLRAIVKLKLPGAEKLCKIRLLPGAANIARRQV